MLTWRAVVTAIDSMPENPLAAPVQVLLAVKGTCSHPFSVTHRSALTRSYACAASRSERGQGGEDHRSRSQGEATIALPPPHLRPRLCTYTVAAYCHVFLAVLQTTKKVSGSWSVAGQEGEGLPAHCVCGEDSLGVAAPPERGLDARHRVPAAAAGG